MKRPFPVLLAAGVSVLLWSGCVTEPPAVKPPMPQVVSTDAPAKVDPTEAIARARNKAQQGDLRGAVAAIQSMPEEQRPAAFRQLATEIAGQDPALGARLALAMPAGDARNDGLASAATAMAARDRATALGWAAALPDAGARHIALSALAEAVLNGQPAEGVRWIESLPNQPGKTELLQLAAAVWARRDADGALAWANSLSGDLRTQITTGIAFELAQSVPARAAAIAATLPENRDRWLLLSTIAQTWIATDPQGAQAWIRALAPGPAHDAAIAGLASATGPVHSRRSLAVQGRYRSPARLPGGGAMADVTSLPPGLERSDAVRREFERRLQESPVRAAQWLATIPAPDVTDDMLLRLARDWYRLDPNAATTWLETNVPSPVRREQILREAQQ